MAEKTKSTGVFIPDITVEMLKKAPIEAIERLFSEGEILDIEEIKESAYQRGLGQNKWIPVSERLPENDEKVLCQTVTKKGQINMVIGYYNFDRWCCGMNSNVTAWMPLPEPYRESETE